MRSILERVSVKPSALVALIRPVLPMDAYAKRQLPTGSGLLAAREAQFELVADTQLP
jgi:hypothetical protein